MVIEAAKVLAREMSAFARMSLAEAISPELRKMREDYEAADRVMLRAGVRGENLAVKVGNLWARVLAKQTAEYRKARFA